MSTIISNKLNISKLSEGVDEGRGTVGVVRGTNASIRGKLRELRGVISLQ